MTRRHLDVKEFVRDIKRCDQCGTTLREARVDVVANVATCNCGATSPIDGLAYLDFNLERPPLGVTFRRTRDGFVVSAMAWSGSAWMDFAWLLLLYISYRGGAQSGPFFDFHGHAGLAWLQVTCSALVPLYVLSALTRIAGRFKLARSGDEGTVFVGIGPLGWTRAFSWAEIASVTEITHSRWSEALTPRAIELTFRDTARTPLRLGSLLSTERRWFVLAVLSDQLTRVS